MQWSNKMVVPAELITRASATLLKVRSAYWLPPALPRSLIANAQLLKVQFLIVDESTLRKITPFEFATGAGSKEKVMLLIPILVSGGGSVWNASMPTAKLLRLPFLTVIGKALATEGPTKKPPMPILAVTFAPFEVNVNPFRSRITGPERLVGTKMAA